MSEEVHDEAAEAAEPGKPASQVEAEHPSGEALAQEARELASRMPGAQAPAGDEGAEADEMAATDEALPAESAEPADEAPAEG